MKVILSESPLDHHKVRGSRIARPCLTGVEQMGVASSDGGLLDSLEGLTVKLGDVGLFWLQSSAPQMNTESLARSCQLAFVEQAHSGETEDNQRSGLLFRRREKGCDPGLVVVFQE